MGFLQFLRVHWATSFGLIFGGLLNVWGVLSDAHDLYQAGIPGWVWQILGVGLVVASLFALLYRFQTEMNQPASSQKVRRVRLRTDTYFLQGVMQRIRASWADTSGRARAAERVMPEVISAFLSLEKERGIPMFPKTGNAVVDLETAYRVLEEIEPLIRGNHVGAAKGKAEEIYAALAK